MKIIMFIKGKQAAVHEVPDLYLRDIDGYSTEQKRQKIIQLHIDQMKRVHGNKAEFALQFESSMNLMDDKHIDTIMQMEDKDLVM